MGDVGVPVRHTGASIGTYRCSPTVRHALKGPASGAAHAVNGREAVDEAARAASLRKVRRFALSILINRLELDQVSCPICVQGKGLS